MCVTEGWYEVSMVTWWRESNGKCGTSGVLRDRPYLPFSMLRKTIVPGPFGDFRYFQLPPCFFDPVHTPSLHAGFQTLSSLAGSLIKTWGIIRSYQD